MITTDLSGRWEVFLDENKSDVLPEKYPDRIELPDSTSNAGLGSLNTETEYGCLTDLHKFEGFAWFRREIEITPEMTGKNITLFLERTERRMCISTADQKGSTARSAPRTATTLQAYLQESTSFSSASTTPTTPPEAAT